MAFAFLSTAYVALPNPGNQSHCAYSHAQREEALFGVETVNQHTKFRVKCWDGSEIVALASGYLASWCNRVLDHWLHFPPTQQPRLSQGKRMCCNHGSPLLHVLPNGFHFLILSQSHERSSAADGSTTCPSMQSNYCT